MNPFLVNLLRGIAAGVSTAGATWGAGTSVDDWKTPLIGGVIAMLGTVLNGLQQRYVPVPGSEK